MTRRYALFTGAVCALCFIALGIFLASLQFLGNFHEVVRGEFYRSAQPTPEQIADYSRRYGIKTIVNLRGKYEKAQWYRGEVTEAETLGIRHVDYPMSATRQISRAELKSL